MLELIFVLIILGVVLWGVQQLPLDGTIKQVIRVVVIVLVVVIVARFILGLASPELLAWPRR